MALYRSGVLMTAVVAALGWVDQQALAYPHFVGYSYNSCVVCHYNPLGNGPLTDYGRALGATVIAAKPPFFRGSDEALGKSAGILGKKTNKILPRALRAQFNYRGLFQKRDLNSKDQIQHIPMVLDGSLILQGPGSRFFAVMNLGHYPTRKGREKIEGTWISREHYVALRPSKKLGVYLGFMDIAYGIRLPDHNLSSRRLTLLNQNDQTHGLLVHSALGKFESSLHLFAGNLLNSPDVRNRGVSFTIEKSNPGNLQLGLSGMRTSNQYRQRTAVAPHIRVAMGEGSAILSEVGVIFETINPSHTSKKYQYWTTQSMTRLLRGVNLLATLDYSTLAAFQPGVRNLQFGGGFQYYPFSRLEVRSELLVNRLLGAETLTSDQLSWLSQVHVWL